MPFRNSIVGGSGSLIRDSIKSPNFTSDPGTGVTGWEIRKDGSATFSDVTIGSPSWNISSDGAASLHSLDVTGYDTDGDGVADSGASFYGKDLTQWLWEKPWGVVQSRRNFSATFQNCVTEVGIGQLTLTTVYGREYEIVFRGMRAASSVNGDRLLTYMRYKWGTSAISIANSDGVVNQTYCPMTTLYDTMPPLVYRLYGDGNTIRFLWTAQRTYGTGTTTVYWDAATPLEMVAYDIGPTNAGDGAWEANNGGGTGAPTTQQYTSVWQATDSASYSASGTKRTDTTHVYQGYYSSNQGNQYGKFVFAGGAIAGQTGVSVSTALSGIVSLDKVEAYVYANHWYYGAGGTGIIRPFNSFTVNNTVPSGSYVSTDNWIANSGKWVDISSISSASIGGFSVGQGPSTSGTYYGGYDGASDTNKPLLRLTYTK